MLVLARCWADDPAWITHVRFTRRAAFVAVVGLGAFVVTQAAELDSIDGLVQRVFAATLLIWITATALRLHSINQATTASP